MIANALQTGFAAALGLGVAVLVGSSMAIALASSRTARVQVLPILVISNAIPVVAIAPLLALWLGHGLASKVAIAAFLCFFPFTLTFLDGLTKSQRVFDELFRVIGASWAQKFRHYVLPNALGNLATGLKVTASIAVIGAVVGEFVGSDRGIGFGILQASYSLNTPRLFAYVVLASAMSLAFYLVPRRWENHLVATGYISRPETDF
jgi:ABC-type nitrate/sulfonate/bicarbonate transport system permease component